MNCLKICGNKINENNFLNIYTSIHLIFNASAFDFIIQKKKNHFKYIHRDDIVLRVWNFCIFLFVIWLKKEKNPFTYMYAVYSILCCPILNPMILNDFTTNKRSNVPMTNGEKNICERKRRHRKNVHIVSVGRPVGRSVGLRVCV